MFVTALDADVEELVHWLEMVHKILDQHGRVIERTYSLIRDLESQIREISQKLMKQLDNLKDWKILLL